MKVVLKKVKEGFIRNFPSKLATALALAILGGAGSLIWTFYEVKDLPEQVETLQEEVDELEKQVNLHQYLLNRQDP